MSDVISGQNPQDMEKTFKEYKEGADKDPEKRLKKLIQHAEAALKRHGDSSYNNFPDFHTNYEQAKKLFNTIKELEKTENPKEYSERLKTMANLLWIRTLMPEMRLKYSKKEDGFNVLVFGDGDKVEGRMKIHPSGYVLIIGGEVPRGYFPPFPGVAIDFSNLSAINGVNR